MPQELSYKQVLVLDGTSFEQAANGLAADSGVDTEPTVPAAKAGTLTTRTDNDTGVLTMASGHGFLTNDKVDVFWEGGSRRNMTATVATNAVTVDGGAGDNLPAASTVVTAMKPVERDLAFNGSDVVAVGVYCPVSGWVVFLDGSDAVVHDYQILPTGGTSRMWAEGGAGTNPLDGELVAKVLFSHADATQARTMKAAVAY